MTPYPRIAAALAGMVWALAPEKLDQIAVVIDAVVSGEVHERIATRADGGRSGSYSGYSLVGDVAVVELAGVMMRRLGSTELLSGGLSTVHIGAALNQADNDPAVRAVLLDVDSPGGEVHGTEELADIVSHLRKPVVAWTGGMMASAAYWVSAAADRIVATETADIGSIGVAAMHYDRSGADEQAGVKRTIITAGQYKRILADNAPLTEVGEAFLQKRVHAYYAMFVEHVATCRGSTPEAVHERMADGRVFLAGEALERGLIDAVGNFETALALARALAEEPMPAPTQTKNNDQVPTAAEQETVTAQVATMDAACFAATYPKQYEAAFAAGVDAERNRVNALLHAGADPGVTAKAIADGMDEGAAFKMFFEAERKTRQTGLEAAAASLGESAGADGKNKPREAGAGEFNALVSARMSETGCSRANAISFVVGAHPDAHAAFLAAYNRS